MTAQLPVETVVVTGISGFLAGHIAQSLLRKGFNVRGTLRDPAKAVAVEDALGAEAGRVTFATADLNSDAGWPEALEGADYVIHSASPLLRVQPDDEDEVIRPAKEGAVRVCAAAKSAGVKRLIFTSSGGAAVYSGGTAPFTEEDWSVLDRPYDTAYLKSKVAAERSVWSFARDQDLEVTVLAPGFMLGPFLGPESRTSVEVVRMLLTGAMPAVPNIAWPLLDVRDAADAHVVALTHPAAGNERFLLGGPFMTLLEIAQVLREAFPEYSASLPTVRVPSEPLKAAADTDPEVRTFLRDLDFDGRMASDKAARTLGWRTRDYRKTIEDTGRRLIELGLS